MPAHFRLVQIEPQVQSTGSRTLIRIAAGQLLAPAVQPELNHPDRTLSIPYFPLSPRYRPASAIVPFCTEPRPVATSRRFDLAQSAHQLSGGHYRHNSEPHYTSY